MSAVPRTPRVTIASRLFPPEPGAAAYRLGSLARALADRGAAVDVLTTRPPRGIRPTVQSEMRVRRWPVLRDRGGNVRGYLQYASFDGPLLLRLLLAARPDVIVVEPPPTTAVAVRLVARARRTPYVYYAGDVSSVAAAGMGVSRWVVRVLRLTEGWTMRGARAVLAVSEGVAEAVEGLGVDPRRVVVVGTGVDTLTFIPAAAVEDTEPALVYAGTMSELQGADVFVRAFARVAADHPRARLHMLGQGSQRDALQDLAERLAPGRVAFEGLVAAERVREAMSAAWAGLASLPPGHGYQFSFPTKMFVATACGTPVLYAGGGPGRAIVQEHHLGWVSDWDVDAVADAMRTALRHPPDAASRARLCRWTAQNASQTSVARKAADCVLGVAGEV